jgi:hypothetical protein
MRRVSRDIALWAISGAVLGTIALSVLLSAFGLDPEDQSNVLFLMIGAAVVTTVTLELYWWRRRR